MNKYQNLDVLFKMGGKGCKYYGRKKEEKKYTEESHGAFDFKDFKKQGLKLVDTTGAGDSFTGAFAVAMVEKLSLKKAL